MSLINRIRIINLKYNHDSIQVGDETFDLNGQSTLLTLRNGGGKTVLVQMMMAPFVHKRYRDLADRPFASYFTSSRPTFILIEWKLDGGGGYVLTGMMVRRNQDAESPEELDITNFISEYRQSNALDLMHIPVTEKTAKGETLKSYAQCRQLFDSWKKESGTAFFYYDMNQSTQSRQYFDKLAEYEIYYREWEAIIHKVNLEESGLSNLFSDCKNEAGLTEKWLLDTVEKKLNRGTDAMKEFRSIMGKYAVQYKDNQSKIKRRDTIEIFRQKAEQIRAEGEAYRTAELDRDQKEDDIACFRDTLRNLLEKQTRLTSDLHAEEEAIQEEVTLLQYQKFSADIVRNEKEQAANKEERDRLVEQRDRLSQERTETERKQHLYVLARQQEELNEAIGDLAETEEKLRLLKEKTRDLAPEREQIGSKLAGFYNAKLKENEAAQKEAKDHLQSLEEDRISSKKRQAEAEASRQKLAGELGAMKERIRRFDESEDHFNQRHQTHLSRNILGEYEDGLLTEASLNWQDQMKKLEEDKKTAEAGKSAAEGEIDTGRRRLDEIRQTRIKEEENLRQAEEKKADFEKELSERKEILRYFGVKEEKLFDTRSILEAADAKLHENEEVRKKMAVELNRLEGDYRQLSGGEVVELSEDFRCMLEDAGIHYLYGMEWLSKNKNTEKQNRRLVRRYPFLPYALLMTRSEAERLHHLTVKTHTSAPIPILIREDLADTVDARDDKGPENATESSVIDFKHVSFYLCFNDALLNRVKLQEMIDEKLREIRQLKEKAEGKDDEYHTYYEQRGIIANQKVSHDSYDSLTSDIESLKEAIAASMARAEEIKKRIDELGDEKRDLEKAIREKDISIRNLTDLMSDFEILKSDYEETLKVMRQRNEALERDQKLEKEITALSAKQEDLESSIRKTDAYRNALQMEMESLRQEAAEFAAYPASKETLKEEEAAGLRKRYEVITSGVSGEQKELEQKARRQTARKQKKEKELAGSAREYGLHEEDWRSIRYDQAEELRLQKEASALLEEMDRMQEGITIFEKKAGALEERRKSIISNMEDVTGRDTPLLPSEIPVIDYDHAITDKKHEMKEKEEERKKAEKRCYTYEENLAALADYDKLVRKADRPLDDSLSGMSDDMIRRRQGELRRDYVEVQNTLRKDREKIGRTLSGIMRSEDLQEDFFQKPLSTLQSLTDSAEQLLNQLHIILSSFDQLIEKLMVDISLVDKEKERITEIMEDYLHRVNTDLGKIDDNSTITIRNRPVKMLKIGTPDWDENQAMYQVRLRDYIDDVTSHCVALLEENRNMEEYLGSRITTKALYDAVAGIRNVTIRLYKIEAEREYPITWSDVAKNSGGEGFLSAFVILTSLLYYLRRNDSDIFADRKETKVLIMDNPFAQTNASHLLIPLMEVAKKSGTQLICLTGLGGESIYNRFDNIYVLSLYASSLRSGMRYLKAEHERGSADESLMVSNVLVTGEQMSLF